MSDPPFPARSPFAIPVHNRIDPGRDRWVRIAVHERAETVSNILRYHFTWQRSVTQYIAQNLLPGDVFVDVGANLGYFTVIAANAVGRGGRVHCFEPEPENLALLRRNLALNGHDHVVVRQEAIGQRDGEAVLRLSDGNLGAHSLLPHDDLRGELRVPVLSLTTALAAEAGPIALVKIDIQGLELAVLSGAEALFARQDPPPRVIMEFNPGAFERVDPGLAGFRAFLRRFGYDLHAFIVNERASTVPPRISIDTLLALHRDLGPAPGGAEFDILLRPRAAGTAAPG